MNTGYKRLICAFCAASAALCMAVTPARAEVCAENSGEGCFMCADMTSEAAALTVLSEDNGEEKKKENPKATLKEQTKSSWQIYACIGGGVLVVIAVISLLAEDMKKK